MEGNFVTILTFEEIYLSICDNCGLELEDWSWLEDDMIFVTTCTCGTEYNLAPTVGILTTNIDDDCDTDDDIEDD